MGTSNTSLAIKRVSITKLKPDPHNARSHSTRNLEAVRSSLKQFGQVEPLVVQKQSYRVIGGNARLSALKMLEESHVDVVEIDIDDIGAKALAIALNRTADLADWDKRNLSVQLDELEKLGYEIDSQLGFSDEELKKIMGEYESDAREVIEDEKKSRGTKVVTCPSCDHEFEV